MDHLRGLRVFREVVEAGSFAMAAKRLQMSAPMASKRLAQLERSLNVRLLHRSSRHLSLTEAGSTYYEQSRHALDIIDAADAEIGQVAEGVRGQLKVSAPVWCANPIFAAALAEYRRQFPDVVLDMHLSNRRVDLVSDGFDLALRATKEPLQSLIARPLCQIRFCLVASPARGRYRKGAGVSAASTPMDVIVPNYVDLEALVAKLRNGYSPPRLKVVMRSDDTTLIYQAVRAGMGAAYLPEWLVRTDLEEKRLMRVTQMHPQPPTHTLFAVYLNRQYMAPKLRTFIDYMSKAAKAW